MNLSFLWTRTSQSTERDWRTECLDNLLNGGLVIEVDDLQHAAQVYREVQEPVRAYRDGDIYYLALTEAIVDMDDLGFEDITEMIDRAVRGDVALMRWVARYGFRSVLSTMAYISDEKERYLHRQKRKGYADWADQWHLAGTILYLESDGCGEVDEIFGDLEDLMDSDGVSLIMYRIADFIPVLPAAKLRVAASKVAAIEMS